ncbi:ATPase P-type H+ transporting proton pump [Lipomyces chichibuensis]|uniref:ATPase P-type H+ transporting proton pump n=1 Tax=Lipomyces chichibuensis TaxID=1546026 RepID=UPI0033442634
MASSRSCDMVGPPQTELPRITIDIPLQDDGDIPDTTTSITRGLSPSSLSASDTISGSPTDTINNSLEPPRTSRVASVSSGSTLFTLDSQEDALKSDPGSEADFVVENNCFSFSPGQLNKLLNPKSLAAFYALCGLRGLEKGLRTDIVSGLSVDEHGLPGTVTFNDFGTPHMNGTSRHFDSKGQSPQAFGDRIRVYGRNLLPEKKPTPLWKLMWLAYNDKILLLLTAAAVISLALGLYETFGADHPPGSSMPVDWVEGLAICVAILIVVLVGSLNDYQKERAFVRLNAKKEDRHVKAIRSGKSMMISVHDVLVGDVLHLEPGDMIPADGIFIDGHNVKCDESSATGESDQLKKTGGEDVVVLIERGHTISGDMDPFIISGSKVLEGVGTYLVTSVGPNSSYGKILMAMRQDLEATPLQVKLDGLTGAIAKLGSSAATLLFVVLLIRFFANLSGSHLTGAAKASQFMDILIVAITVIVVAVPEGLPLAVTLALAFATTRLVKLNNLVRVLKSCETMGNATTICSDKTGTLTQNKMTVVAGTFGDLSFDDKNNRGHERQSTIFAQDLSTELKRTIVEITAGDAFVGSKTKTALLDFARNVLAMGPLSEERSTAQVVELMPLIPLANLPNGSYRYLVKGASEILLGYSSDLWMKDRIQPLTQPERERIEAVIESYAKQCLRTISLIFKDFPQWPPKGAESSDDPTAADFNVLLKHMIFVGVVGIQDPLRHGVTEAIAKCQGAGVTVRMVTGDNVVTAMAIAKDCGIYTDGVVIEGPVFRTLTESQMIEMLPRIQVVARSSPEDKRILVTRLRQLCEVVAVTGDGTNDGPALKAADIGFSMGIAGTEVAKEASAIILMDDNFASILTALMWGRAVNDAVRKFLQFQITVNITAVILTFVSSVASTEMKSVLTAVQLLWINLIMDTLAALALATDPPTEEILNRKPSKRTAPLISIIMWKMVIGQAIFQLTVTLILHFGGPTFLGYPDDELRSVVFNTFVWMQIFNEFNNRRLDNKFNVFTGLHRNWFFIVITCIMVGGQVAISFVGGVAFSIVRINGTQWAICIVAAMLSMPWAVLIRCFPDAWFAAIAGFVGKPVVSVYRVLSRFMGWVRRLIPRKNKKQGDETFDNTEDGSEFVDYRVDPKSQDLEKGLA